MPWLVRLVNGRRLTYNRPPLAGLLPILTDILLPILLLMAAGAWLRSQYRLDMQTLSKLNLYVLSPAFVFRYVATSDLGGPRMAAIVGVSATMGLTLAGLAWVAGRAAGASWRTTSAVMLACLVYNSGNYGLPLAELAFGPRGVAAQVFVLATQTILTFTVGLALAGTSGGGGWRRPTGIMLRIPILYALVAALAWRWLAAGRPLPPFADKSLGYLAAGLIPVALVTLGAQMAGEPRWPRWRPVGFVVLARLVLAPLVMTGLLLGLHRLFPGGALDLWPWPAAVLIATSGVPTAVNTLLLTIEVDGDVRLAADAVFWTTALSAATVLILLWVVSQAFGIAVGG